MAEEIKAVRLSKAAKEVNVSTGTIQEFLLKKGFEIDSNPNTRLSPEQYALVLKEFQSDKAISEKAQELKLETVPKKTVVAGKATSSESPEPAGAKDLFIKTAEISSPLSGMKGRKAKAEEQPEGLAPASEPDHVPASPVAAMPAEASGTVLQEKGAEAKAGEKAQEKAAAGSEEAAGREKAEEEPVSSRPAVSEKAGKTEPAATEAALSGAKPSAGEALPESQDTEPSAAVATKEEVAASLPASDAGKDAQEAGSGTDAKSGTEIFKPHSSVIAGPKIVSTMDARTLALAKEGKAVKPEKIASPQIVSRSEEPAGSEPGKAAPAETPREEAKPKEDNFIKTQYVKLEGPVVTGQRVDLSQFERKPKPVASSKDTPGAIGKKRRKRIKDESSQPGLHGMGQGRGSMPGGQGGGNASQQGALGRPVNAHPGRKNEKRSMPAPAVDSQEIEKQIKETLARLSPLGKSKTSKHRREKRQIASQHLEMEHQQELLEKQILRVTEFVTVNELATMMNVPVNQIISTCMSLGLFVSINQRLSAEPISLLAEEYGFKVEFVDADVIHELESQDDEDEGEEVPRTPIVTVMGHVDHGKTSLLDYIRKTNVIAGEAGGITQHIGAYEVQLDDGRKITFLDTPGHEAFTAMRARGAKITDIAIIVVAADDKVMPQTVEAINHAQAAGVPIVFAINKVDKPSADPERIKGELAEMNLLVEDWGGKYQSQDISAKQGTGVEALLEKVLLEAEILDLKAHPQKRGRGTIIESSLDKGRGYVAKILVQDGTIRVGDFVLAGYTYGRIKAMYNERNQPVKEAGPSQPVLLLGLNGAPQPGDVFNMMTDEKEAKEIANKRLQLQREQGLRTQKHITLDEIGRRIAIGDFKELNIIVKADVDGSVEALSDSLLKLSTPEVQVNVIHKSVGQITESDVLLASASEAIIIGFQVRPSVAARKMAENEQIDIRLYSIIYTAINEIKDAIEGMLSPEIQEKIVANLEVREVFKISKVGSIAGCIVLDGRLGRNTRIRIIRDGIVVYTGELGSLRRFKDDVKEVVVGQDCGLNIKNFNDVKVGDIIEGYDQVEVKRTL